MIRDFLGEFIGTFLLILFGIGSVAVAVLYGAHVGIFPIAIVWSLAVTIPIYLTRGLSNAHFNPAVSVAMCATGRMPWQKLPIYLFGQMLGGFLGGLTIYGLFSSTIEAFEKSKGIVRGTFDSVQTAKMFGEYYYQPGSLLNIGMWHAALVELVGTFLLVLFLFLLTEGANEGRPSSDLAPLFIGLTVGSIIALLAPLTQAGLNPARDLAPRFVAMIFGWGEWAFPDSSGGYLWVYVVGPIIGGLIAGFLFTKVLEPQLKKK